MTEVEFLTKIINDTIKSIKELQLQLEKEEKEEKELGCYEDCGSFYKENVIKTKAIIADRIEQKIRYEKWRKKLKYEMSTNHIPEFDITKSNKSSYHNICDSDRIKGYDKDGFAIKKYIKL